MIKYFPRTHRLLPKEFSDADENRYMERFSAALAKKLPGALVKRNKLVVYRDVSVDLCMWSWDDDGER